MCCHPSPNRFLSEVSLYKALRTSSVCNIGKLNISKSCTNWTLGTLPTVLCSVHNSSNTTNLTLKAQQRQLAPQKLKMTTGKINISVAHKSLRLIHMPSLSCGRVPSLLSIYSQGCAHREVHKKKTLTTYEVTINQNFILRQFYTN